MVFKFNQKFNKNLLLILITTFIYSILVGSGFYGYGNDYYAVYIFKDLKWGEWNDRLGFAISTFTIFGKNYGIYIVSAILAFSSGILINSFLKNKKIYSSIFFIIIYILVLHTWPIIMSTSNVMRQGITMSLVFLCFANLLNQKYFMAMILIFISSFTHKTGIIYFCIFLSIWTLRLASNKIPFSKNLHFILIFLLSVFLFILTYYFLKFYLPLESESRIISGDFRYQFLIINLSFIIIFIYKYKNLISNDVILFMYLFNFVSMPFFFLGYNWQYERLMMMMTIPYLLIFSNLFYKKYSYFFLLFSFILLLSLTIYQGIYEELIK